MTTRQETGVIHGRFQILHNDHLKYLLAGKKLCHHLVVGITNPDPYLSREEKTDPNRSAPMANPLTYYERYIMIKTALAESGVDTENFSIVPLAVNFPERYQYYVPMDALFFLTIYDDWGRQKKRYFESLGLKTHPLWERPLEKKGISATKIRERMIRGEPWEDQVPPSTALLLKRWKVQERLRKITGTFPKT